MNETQTLPDTRPLFRTTVAQVTPLIDAVTPDDLGRPTPCSDWTVRELLSHLVAVEDRIVQKANDILEATSSEAWKRIEKAQTKTQWDYIARIAKGVLTLLELDPSRASEAVRNRFGSSGYESLEGTILPEEAQ